jgi:hypothetical protein
MRRGVVPLSFAVLLFALAGRATADDQVVSTGTNYGSGMMKVSPIGKDVWVSMLDQLGMRVDERGKGPFHLVTTDLQLILYRDTAGQHYRAFEIWVDMDGDKVLWELSGEMGKGKGTAVMGTGKFAGITGTMEFVLQDTPQTFPEGSIRTVCKETVKVVLKKPL